MKSIDLYSFCYNDEDFMPFFLAHYLPLVDRITFIDNGSTDRTLDLIEEARKANAKPCIRVIHTGQTTWDWDECQLIRNTIWKQSDYDLMMWSDLDEIIYRPDLREYLEKTDFDIFQTIGYDMVSTTFPKAGTDILSIKAGARATLEDKYLIWKRSSGIEFDTAHTIKPTNENISRGEIKLLHYKYLGADRMYKRAEDIKARVPRDSFCKGINGNILAQFPDFVKTKPEYVNEIAYRISTAINVI